MKKIVKDILVAAAIGLVVGALVSFAAPTIAAIAGTGAAGAMGNTVFMALFAASWGAFGAAITPAISFLANKLGGNKHAALSQDINTSSPMQTIEPEMDFLQNGKFAQMIEAEKAKAVELTR